MINKGILDRNSVLSIKNQTFESQTSSKFRSDEKKLKNKMMVIHELNDDYKTIKSKELNDVETEKLSLQAPILKKLSDYKFRNCPENDKSFNYIEKSTNSINTKQFANCLNQQNNFLRNNIPYRSRHINNAALPRSSTFNTNNTCKEDIFEHNETEDSNRTARTLNINSKLLKTLEQNDKYTRRDTITNIKIPCKLTKTDIILFDLSKKSSYDENNNKKDDDFDICPILDYKPETMCRINSKPKSDNSLIRCKSSLNKIIIQPEEVKNEILLVQKQYTNIGEFNSPHEVSLDIAPRVAQNMNFLLNSSTQYDSNKMEINGLNSSPIIKTASKWNKLKNVFRSLKSLKTYETKNLENESDLDSEMRCYKERLLGNTLKSRELERLERGSDGSKKKGKGFFDTQFNLLLKINEDSLERKKNFKEEIYKIIISGNSDAVNAISCLMKKDPEFYLISHKDPKFKYNLHLENGKTLLYSACQEGRLDLVSYFVIERKLDPFVKSREGESPLGVSCRWSYTQIVTLLLKNVEYKKEHIKEVLKINGLTEGIKNQLFNYIKKNFKNTCCG
jgi:hypothetical protein